MHRIFGNFPNVSMMAMLSVVLAMSFAACGFHGATPAPMPTSTPEATVGPTSQPVVINDIGEWYSLVREIVAAPSKEAQARADEVWHMLVSTHKVPLALGEYVVFLYKGNAQSVEWSGVFNRWALPGLGGDRIGGTDLWYEILKAPAASRIEYKIILDGQDWIVDPANPNMAVSGLTGNNSVLVMPGFTVTDVSQPRSGVKSGTLTDDLSIQSKYLGYAVNYRVYLPAGYENVTSLPVIYVLDGNDFADERMGALPPALDNMIADGRIKPVLAVFVDSRQPGNPQINRREDEFLVYPVEHAQFIVEEMVPAIDQAYRTDARPEGRTIAGASFGGLSAIYIAATQSAVFHNVAAFSPSMWVIDNPQYLPKPEQLEPSRLMVGPLQAATDCGGDSGITCPSLPIKIFLTYGVPDWDVGDLSYLAETLKNEHYPVESHFTNEGHAWSAWRGLTDEMLVYFFGTK